MEIEYLLLDVSWWRAERACEVPIPKYESGEWTGEIHIMILCNSLIELYGVI